MAEQGGLSRTRWSTTLRFSLLPAAAVAVVAVVTALMLLLAQQLLVRHLGQMATLRSVQQAADLAQRLDRRLHAMQRELQLLARSRALPADTLPLADPRALRPVLDELLRSDPRFVWIGLAAPDGRVLAGSRGWLEGESVAQRPVFLRGREGSFVGEPHPAVMLGALMAAAGVAPQQVLDFGEPVRDAQGRVVAVLTAHAGTAWLDEVRAAALRSDDGAAGAATRLFVLDATVPRSVLPGEAVPEGLPAVVAAGAALRSADGRRWFGATADLGRPDAPALLPWRVMALQPRDAALGPAWPLVAALGLMGVVAATAVGLGGSWLARRELQRWSPVMDAVLAGAGATTDPRALADAVAAALDRRHADAPAAGIEELLGRLARGTRDLRRIVDHLPVGVAVLGPDFRVEYLNRTYTRLLGWTTEQVRGRIAAEFLFDAGERADFVRLFAQFGDTPGEVAARFDALRPDATRVPVQWHLVPIVDDGGVQGGIAVVTDIRPERAATARADAMAGRLRALSDAAIDTAIATLDADGRVLEWSRGAARLSGHVPSEAVGRPLDALLPPAGEPPPLPLAEAMRQARRDGLCPFDGPRAVAGGGQRWFEGALYPLGLAPGAARFGLLLRDTTATREVAAALADSEARLRLALQAAAMGRWDIDLRERPPRVHWSEGYGQMLGLPTEALAADEHALLAHVHPADRSALRAALRETVRDGVPLAAEFRVLSPQGERWHAVQGRALRSGTGQALRLLGVGMDITARRVAEQALQDSRRRLVRIVDTMAEGLVVLDAQGRYVLANPAAARIVGVHGPQDIVGLRFDTVPWQRIHLDASPPGPAEHPFLRLRAGRAPIEGERVVIRRADGTRRTVSLNVRPLRSPDGGFDGVVMSFVDVTARVDSEARLAGIVAGASDAIVSTDAQGRVQLFNPAAERIFGVAADALHGQPLDRLLPPAVRSRHGALMDRFAQSGVTQRAMGVGRVEGRHADGRTLVLEASISQHAVDGLPTLTAILRDVTERAAHERALETTRGELAELTARLLEQEKQTTRRLAQLLHDELGQTLTALRLHWEALRAGEMPATDPAMQAQRTRIDTLLQAANRQVRGVLGELRPPMLDESGLVAALDNEIGQQRPPGGMPQVRLEVPPRLQGQRWPADVEYAAFMVAREALGNALVHAGAREVRLTVEGDEGELTLRVADDGAGIAEAERAGRPGHLGVVGMRERALAIGATLRVDSPGQGTEICLHWTLQ